MKLYLANEIQQKKASENEKTIDILERENKKLKAINMELIKSQVKVLEDAIEGAKDIVASTKKQ